MSVFCVAKSWKVEVPIEMKYSQEQLQQQICVCYDVYLHEIVEQIEQGETSIDNICEHTYACQGCGGCRPKLEKIMQNHLQK